MKICFFTKYPPIEGGVSARSYWLTTALGEKGIEIHVVTNALGVEDEYKENINWEDLNDLSKYQPPNVMVHSLKPDTQLLSRFFHIPQSPAYLERLISKGLEVIKHYQCDLIDSFYILPYGLAGFILKLLTGKPQILRHAGSDMGRLFFNPELRNFFLVTLKNTDYIVTFKDNPIFQQMNIGAGNLHPQKPPMPYPLAFNPEAEAFDFKKLGIEIKKDMPVITYIGKFHEEVKGIYELVRALSNIKSEFFLLLVTGGKNLSEFEIFLKKQKRLRNKYKIAGFLPPWHIPGIIKNSACIVQLEKNFSIKTHSPIQLHETMAVGKPCLISDELFEKFRERLKLEDRKNVLVANPKDPNQLEEKLELILTKPELLEKIGQNAHNTIDWQKEFDEYIEDNLRLYEKAVSQRGVYIDRALELYEKILKKIKFR